MISPSNSKQSQHFRPPPGDEARSFGNLEFDGSENPSLVVWSGGDWGILNFVSLVLAEGDREIASNLYTPTRGKLN